MRTEIDLNGLRRQIGDTALTPQRRATLQQELARSHTPAAWLSLQDLLRRLPAAGTADIRDLLYR